MYCKCKFPGFNFIPVIDKGEIGYEPVCGHCWELIDVDEIKFWHYDA